MRYLLVVVAASLAGVVHAQEYTRYQGGWSGPFLLYVAQQDTGAQGPPAVIRRQLQIDHDGSVRGQLPDAACTPERLEHGLRLARQRLARARR